MQSFILPSRSLLIVTSTLLRVGAFTKSTPLYHNILSRSMDRCNDSLFKSFSSFDDDFVGMQKKVGENDSIATTYTIENHLSHQKKVFDEMATFFDSEEATPEEVKPVLRYLVKKTLNQIKTAKDNDEDKIFKILDVGCGTGALFPYYLEAANELQIRLNIVGLDLSPKMVEYATENSIKMLSGSDGGSRHDIRCEAGDFVKTVMGVDYCEKSLTGFENGVVDEKTEKFREEFDAVVINACFGNFLDQDSVVMAAGSSLKIGGVFVISHPLGSAFVEKLRKDNPSTVPNPLPTEDKFNDLLEFQPFAKMDFIEKGTVSDGVEDHVTLFYASSKRVHHRILREVVRLRGDVDEGYGRGGKKLGFPTANLPSSLFADALTNVPTGVYFGWVVIEDSLNDEKKGRNVVHKAVVNVGYSPTFEGKENKEKIVEAHLIVENGDIEGDFYGETMRLALCGFLRPEKRFPSFPDLIAAITNDVANAKKFLDSVPYSNFSKDDFLQNPTEQWVGSSGGDDGASYEFTSTNKFLGK
mmetsp:Transcript_7931/g.12410  ORF Transcript_7931/g.12410 Transcript_7931/m.12410 type:complete len:527 (+) Transcript_7931:167-1747(+)|eukprot:CAMPEP_0194250854 /NCGR_PEP_ID=MMETSP0158-20130606/24070_1 /TAXON_ID=33649 /ORGANISM="Thalassionema nitzschioides, Strain L26-B" /LENGTH=526 /DNA_ID=CAMNT_0038987799 /DNA_START=141 /DNA_END=1724 /DNA_ORIENTATION=-